MSAAFARFKPPEAEDRESSVHPGRLLFGRYVPFRSVVIPGLEVLWLLVSSLAVFALNRAITGRAGPLPWGQVGTLAVIYLTALFLMDLYNLDQVERRGEMMTNLAEAMGLVCVAVAVAQYAFGFLVVSLWLALLQLSLTAALTLFARTVIGPRLRRRGGQLRVGFIGGARARAEIDKEHQTLTRLGFVIEPLGESVQQAARWFRLRVHERGLRHLVIDDACLGEPEGHDFIEEWVSDGIEIVRFSAFCERALGKVALGPHLLGDLRVAERNPGEDRGQSFPALARPRGGVARAGDRVTRRDPAGDRDQMRFRRPGVLYPGTNRQERSPLSDVQVPLDASKHRGRERTGLDYPRARPPRNPGRRGDAPVSSRRVAAARQCSSWRDEPGGSTSIPSGALCEARHFAIFSSAAAGPTRHHRLGTDPLQLRGERQ